MYKPFAALFFVIISGDRCKSLADSGCNVHCKDLIANEIRAGQNTFVEKVDRMETHLTVLENQFQSMQRKIDNQLTAIQDILSRSDRNVIPPGFNKIGSRYFYIEKNNEDSWNNARTTCIKKGGHLAAIKNQEELVSLGIHLDKHSYYWLGIHEEMKKGNFVSAASGKVAPFISWKQGEPEYVDLSLHCVVLNDGLMYTDRCHTTPHFFICQADDDV